MTYSRGTYVATQTLGLSYLKNLPYMFYNTAQHFNRKRIKQDKLDLEH